MKVLFVGDFSQYSTNISQAQAFERIGCEVHRYDFRQAIKEFEGTEDVESSILWTCQDFRPDITLFSKCNELLDSVVDKCKPSWRVLWYMDPVNSNFDPCKEKMRKADIVYCNIYQAFQAANGFSNAWHLQEGFDPLVDRLQPEFRTVEHKGRLMIRSEYSSTKDNVKHDYDVTFIGGLHNDREDYQEHFTHLKAYGDDHARAAAWSKINLNFTDGGASDRVYKIMAAGGFLLTQPWPQMAADFEIGKDLEIFRGEYELKQMISYFLAHEDERKQIAANGYLKVQKFNRTAWAKRIVEDAK